MFSGIWSFIAVFGTLLLVSISAYTVTISQLSNIEKAFGLSSSESGWLLTASELGYVTCTVFASYFGARAHLPRAIGVATILCGLSGIIFILPHFIAFSDSNNFDNVRQNETLVRAVSEINMCVNRTDTANFTSMSSSTMLVTLTKGSGKTIAYALLSIGMILQGAGRGPCYPYSTQYVDDNVDKAKTGFYTGIISSIAVFGLAIGYGLGSITSNIYVTLESTPLSSTDTRFIGAWWLGFVIVSVATLLTAIPMFCFPRKLKRSQRDSTDSKDSTQQHTHMQHNATALAEFNLSGLITWAAGLSCDLGLFETRKTIANSGGLVVASRLWDIVIRREYGWPLKSVVRTIVSISKSPVYVLTLISMCFQVLAFSAFFGFEPKYMETQFSIPSWQANIVLGVVYITSYSIGCFFGGYITKKWTMSPFNNLLFVVIFVVIVTLLLVVTTFLGCGHQTIHNSPADPSYASIDLPCECNTTEFLPICGNDGKSYFSPCHAGCTEELQNTFSNCSAIPGGSATMGVCPSNCNMFWPYSVTKFVMNLIDAIASIPIFLVFLRAAGEEHKALAIGLSAAVTSITAWVPGPVIGGKLIDSTCLIWNTAPTSGQYCAYYNVRWQRFRLHGFMIGTRLVALVFLFMALMKAKKLIEWPKAEPTAEYEAVNIEADDTGKTMEHLATDTATECGDQ